MKVANQPGACPRARVLSLAIADVLARASLPRRSVGSRALGAWSGAILASAFALGAGTPASAQSQERPASLEEILVTGSRIVRRDYESNSPIVTVDSEAVRIPDGTQLRVLSKPTAELQPCGHADD